MEQIVYTYYADNARISAYGFSNTYMEDFARLKAKFLMSLTMIIAHILWNCIFYD